MMLAADSPDRWGLRGWRLVCPERPVLTLMCPLVVLLAGQEGAALTVRYSSSSVGLDHPGQTTLPTRTSEPWLPMTPSLWFTLVSSSGHFWWMLTSTEQKHPTIAAVSALTQSSSIIIWPFSSLRWSYACRTQKKILIPIEQWANYLMTTSKEQLSSESLELQPISSIK